MRVALFTQPPRPGPVFPSGATAWRRSSRSVAFAPSTSATISPSRMTRIRVAIPTSSPSSDETTTPRSRLPRARRSPGRAPLWWQHRRLGWARRAGARGSGEAASVRARPSAGCRRRVRPASRSGLAGTVFRACSCSLAAVRSSRTLRIPCMKRPRSARLTFLVRLHSSRSPWDLRSSGANPSPAAIARSGRLGGRRLPSIRTSPSSRGSTP